MQATNEHKISKLNLTKFARFVKYWLAFHGNDIYHNIVIFSFKYGLYDIKISDTTEMSKFLSPVSISQKTNTSLNYKKKNLIPPKTSKQSAIEWE